MEHARPPQVHWAWDILSVCWTIRWSARRYTIRRTILLSGYHSSCLWPLVVGRYAQSKYSWAGDLSHRLLPAVDYGRRVAFAVVWVQILNPEFGCTQRGLYLGLAWGRLIGSLIRLGPKPAFIIMTLWLTGFQMIIIFLAGLQGVPKELQEAAEIDGANTWRRFLSVTIPIISPIIFSST